MKRAIALLMSLAMLLALLAGCGGRNQADAGTANQGSRANAGDADASGDTELKGEIKLALITGLTGTGKETGDRQIAAAEVAVNKINGEGGVNGAKVVLELFDSGADQQSCINAVQLAANTEGIAGIVGVFQPVYNIAYSDIIQDAGIPCMCLGTSYNVRDLKNPYM